MNAPLAITTHHKIAKVIRTEIISGLIKPGTEIDEQQLAKKFGVSSAPVRDAIFQLNIEGVIECKKNTPPTVAPLISEDLRQLLLTLMQKIEIQAISSQINKARQADIDSLSIIFGCIKLHYKHNQLVDTAEAMIDFHKYLVDMEGGDELVNVWHPIVMRLVMNTDYTNINPEHFDYYKAIIEALTNQDELAALKALPKSLGFLS
ncbi:GntR family transcriptional regulator [Saccharobesus litoralis]|uniref:GntR family transcriptional regulator n=1 Tax=Saccharobesus litoralis TaxID=2172099 RepID=A0A2S0VP85_9ALTE|nr:GntR family transcriptional regulator [Saccharobesus litoralis]AWB66002.1 GntR family transcriptional regulator [Saccharobesus litoralis]